MSTPGPPHLHVVAAPCRYDDSDVVRRADGLLAFRCLEPSLVAMLRAVTRQHAGAEALVELDGPRLTYSQLWDEAARVAGGLHGAGIRRGDRVAITLDNGVDWCLAFFGVLLAGAVVVPVNTRFTPDEAQFVIDDAAAGMVISPGTPLPHGAPMAVEDMRADELAALFYTSGTTGFPKGAMLTHGNIVSALESAQRALLLPAGVRTLVPVPLFHVMGALNQLLPTCRAGGTTVIMRGFDVPRWLDAIRSERINVVSAVPAIYWQALQHPDFDQLNTGGVGWVVYGGAATPPEQVRRLSSAFPGARLFSGYGLTESSGGVTGLPHEFAEERADSVGVALPTVEIAVRGPSAAQGCGELLLRAPQIMAGYWQRPDETADVTIDGWFATGDAVEVSTDGFIRIVDRIKDTINRGGENVYCIEVENVLGAHPDVAEVAVIGVADPMMGEKVGAVVVPAADAAIEPAALVAWAGERMADFKVPQYVHVASQPLPRNAAGKVNKPALRSSTTWGTPLR